jgi:hypothetical protein
MRITSDQQAAIRTAVTEAFGAGAFVWLFGSRADDAKRKVDVVIETPEPLALHQVHALCLEQLGWLSNAESWIALRQVRNQFTHDYPDCPAQCFP